MGSSMKVVLQSYLRNMSTSRTSLAEKSKSLIPCTGCWTASVATNVPKRSIATTPVAWKRITKISSSSFLENRNSLGLCDKRFGSFEKVAPRNVSEKMAVPEVIQRPDYYLRSCGTPSKPIPKKPAIRTEQEIYFMRESCKLAKFVLETTLMQAQAGVTTDQLDKFAHELILKNNAFPSALGYRKFPKSICTSVNNVACHGIPDDRKLVSGDIISVDVMVYKNGFHGDCCGTGLVGNVDEPGQKLVAVAEECTTAGIKACGPGVPFANIGKAIEAHANSKGLSVLPVFTGHGVGRFVHEKPDIFHYCRENEESKEAEKEVMKPGMTFTIEPIITQGMDLVMVLSDNWTAVTVDGARTAQFENTVLITENGVEILTACNLIKLL